MNCNIKLNKLVNLIIIFCKFKDSYYKIMKFKNRKRNKKKQGIIKEH